MQALTGLDYFVPNESEAETITGMRFEISTTRRSAPRDSWRVGFDGIITLGANGSLLAGRDWMEHLPAFPVKPSTARRWRCVHRELCVFLGKGCRSGKQCSAPICTQGFQRPGGNAEIFLRARPL